MSNSKFNNNTTGSNSDFKLDHKSEVCLSAYVDGECGWFKRLIAKRFLKSSFEARKFVADLEFTSGALQTDYAAELNQVNSDVSLWPKISARIAQEERLKLLRSIPLDSNNSLSWFSRLSWGGMGAVAASLLFTMFIPLLSDSRQLVSENMQIVSANKKNVSSDIQLSRSGSGTALSNVLNRVPGLSAAPIDHSSLVSSQARYEASDLPNPWRFAQDRPQFLNLSKDEAEYVSLNNQRRNIAPQVFEADWMRSNGRVKVLQDPSGKAAIIWINKPRVASPPVARNNFDTAVVERVGNR